MTRRATFTQAAITRAIKGAQDAGMTVARCEIGLDGRIILTAESVAATPPDPFAEWKARRSASRAQGSA
jgi:hypothetical protein